MSSVSCSLPAGVAAGPPERRHAGLVPLPSAVPARYATARMSLPPLVIEAALNGATPPALDTTLTAALRTVRDVLEPLAVRFPAAVRALDLLNRDLLPRTGGGDAYLVIGIVGPNNAGKSALFNALVGRDLSPSLPAGGATRRLVGAAHPDLLGRLAAEPTLARFRFQRAPSGAQTLPAALETSPDPTALLVAAEPSLPPTVLLIDTPDFDSILADNRVASESLLAVADLVIAVVTRHSYQNREVVTFLEHWLAHGRPWMLVYNESIDDGVTRAHASKLAADLGTAPLALFAAPHSLAIQRGAEPLVPVELGHEHDAPPTAARTLRQHLFALETVTAVKASAFDAALARLRDDVGATAAALTAGARESQALLDAADDHALGAGSRIATGAMPAGPFVDAFRAVLDRRSNPLSRTWRGGLRHLRLAIESVPAWLRGRRDSRAANLAQTLTACERDELRRAWPGFWEGLARDLGPEARHPARQAVPAAVATSLDADLADGQSAAARTRAEAALATAPVDTTAFQAACERLVETAIADRGFDLDIQVAADIATVLPLAFAAAVIVKTGGLGTDLAAAGGGALSTFLMEKYAHVLGSGVMADARRRWAELRGRQLARVLTEAALPGTVPTVRTAADRDAGTAAHLEALAQRCRLGPAPGGVS